MARLNKQVFTLGIPFLLGLAAVILHAPFVHILCFVSHFLLLRFVPLFKGRENLWMFLMTALSAIPVNIGFLIEFGTYGVIFYPSFLPAAILRGALYFFVLFSAEEVIMASLTRLIFKNQKKTIF